MKGDALEPDYSHNSYIILQTISDVAEVKGNIALVYNENIESDYTEGYTIRRLELEQVSGKKSLFPETRLTLKATNPLVEDIVLSEIKSNEEIKLIGMLKVIE